MKKLTDAEMRLECVRLALEAKPSGGEDVLVLARTFYGFVADGLQIDGKPEHDDILEAEKRSRDAAGQIRPTLLPRSSAAKTGGRGDNKLLGSAG